MNKWIDEFSLWTWRIVSNRFTYMNNQLHTLEKGMNYLVPQLKVKYYCHYPSARALALNNPQRLRSHSTKEPKQNNQTTRLLVPCNTEKYVTCWIGDDIAKKTFIGIRGITRHVILTIQYIMRNILLVFFLNIPWWRWLGEFRRTRHAGEVRTNS